MKIFENTSEETEIEEKNIKLNVDILELNCLRWSALADCNLFFLPLMNFKNRYLNFLIGCQTNGFLNMMKYVMVFRSDLGKLKLERLRIEAEMMGASTSSKLDDKVSQIVIFQESELQESGNKWEITIFFFVFFFSTVVTKLMIFF